MKLIISDETLRDGEQQVGVNFSINDKFKIAEKLARCGVDQIAIMPAISKYEEKLAKKLLRSNFKEKIFASTMLDKKFVDHSCKLGFRNIILFTPLSDRLLKTKGMEKNQNLIKTLSVCRYAKEKKMKIFFAGEDATRADLNYVVKFIEKIEKYIEGFILCDTVGVLTPIKTKKFIKKIKSETSCNLGIHFHNDRGLANKNSLVALQNGANILSATTGGIGERAGNADFCEILPRLEGRGAVKSKKYIELLKIRELVYTLGGAKPAKPYSAKAFWHESGIHVNSLMKDPLSYNSFLPERFKKKNRIFYGKFSGVSNYRFLFGNEYGDKQLIKIRDKVKDLSYKNKRSYSAGEIKGLLRKKVLVV